MARVVAEHLLRGAIAWDKRVNLWGAADPFEPASDAAWIHYPRADAGGTAHDGGRNRPAGRAEAKPRQPTRASASAGRSDARRDRAAFERDSGSGKFGRRTVERDRR